jgi:hypothetical protein
VEAFAGGAPKTAEQPVRWRELLTPTGAETRLGDALRQLIEMERHAAVSGIVVVSDGCQNAGGSVDAALETARKARIPIVTIGVGSDKGLPNVGVVDLVAPARHWPRDPLTVVAYVRAEGMADQTVTVELLSRDAGNGGPREPGTGERVASARVLVGSDGEVAPVRFEVRPDWPGLRTYCVRVQAPGADMNATDNFRETDVAVVERRTEVLLFAGGPTREYRFLNRLLFRDRSTSLNVLLQTAGPRTVQNADVLLSDFPESQEEMSNYDCVVAIDPDWQRLSEEQVELLQTWVRQEAGGLLLIAGSVCMGSARNNWVEQESMRKIRALYPVAFSSRREETATIGQVSKQPRPIRFTRRGRETGFLQLEDDAEASGAAWANFEGVFSGYPVRRAKPGATVLARLSSPAGSPASEEVPYFVSQFYGAGRVFYAGSGEMWRLHSIDDTYFERYYANLVGHLSHGRLWVGSRRGVLLLRQNRVQVGAPVELHAVLTNTRYEPLPADHVTVDVISQQGGPVRKLRLQADELRRGTFAGRVASMPPGEYRLELRVPDSQDELLVQKLSVCAPRLEIELSRRNDLVLRRIAAASGGRYVVGLKAAMKPDAR